MTEAMDQEIQLIKRFKGIGHQSYFFPAGKLTIGSGRTRGVEPGRQITNQQAEELLKEKVLELESDPSWPHLHSRLNESPQKHQELLLEERSMLD